MADWTIIARYPTRMEAELFAAILQEEDIPVIMRGSDVGIFGPGFGGATAMGVQILVHEEDVERAHELIARED